MDLLGSILTSMDKPPAQNEEERKAAKELKRKLEKEQAMEKKRREELRKKIVEKIGIFMEDGTKKRMKFSPMDKIYRSIVHEVAETAGLIAHSFGIEEIDRHVMLFKKEHAPTEEELQALRAGEIYDPTKVQNDPTGTCSSSSASSTEESQRVVTVVPPQSNYREKYKHLISTEIEEPSPVKTEPERQFGFVPSSNKRDLRSIEETLKDLRSRKKAKMDQTDATNEQ